MAESDEKKRMNPEAKKLWVEALRSDKYQQGKGALKTIQGSFCCLGVLCDLSGQGKWQEELFQVTHADGKKSSGTCRNLYVTPGEEKKDYISNSYPPSEVLLWAGIDGATMHKLSSMNDGWMNDAEHPQQTFEQIAQWIEDNL